MERLYQEIEWFSKNQIDLVMGADANFGIYKRDKELTQRMADTKMDSGFPEKFRVCFAKNSDDKVFEIARILNNAELSKGISISMQSLNPNTLKEIKRHNIKTETFHKLQSRYIEEGIATYTELIIGLPGETYQTFVDGIDTLIDNGQHQQLNIYNCTIMPNAEMGSKDYIERYGIKTVDIPIFQGHSVPFEKFDDIPEFDKVVIKTNTLSLAEWHRTHYFSWVVQCFHLLGITQAIAIGLRYQYDIPYSTFYEEILSYGRQNPQSLIGYEIVVLDDILSNVLAGIGFDQYLPEFLDVTWPSEEASFLRLSKDIEGLYQEIRQILDSIFKLNDIQPDEVLLRDLILYQQAMVVNYNRNGDIALHLHFNLPDYIRECMIGKPHDLQSGDFLYTVIDNWHLNGDKERFAREVVWYGRRGGKFLYPIVRS